MIESLALPCAPPMGWNLTFPNYAFGVCSCGFLVCTS